MQKFGLGSVAVAVIGLVFAMPALADHTNPRTPLAPTNGSTSPGLVRGDGSWQHVANFPGGANNALTGGGTDLEFFTPPGGSDIYGAFGTLGQDDVGQHRPAGGPADPRRVRRADLGRRPRLRPLHDLEPQRHHGTPARLPGRDAEQGQAAHRHDGRDRALPRPQRRRHRDRRRVEDRRPEVRASRGAPRAFRGLLAHAHGRRSAALDHLQQQLGLQRRAPGSTSSTSAPASGRPAGRSPSVAPSAGRLSTGSRSSRSGPSSATRTRVSSSPAPRPATTSRTPAPGSTARRPTQR